MAAAYLSATLSALSVTEPTGRDVVDDCLTTIFARKSQGQNIPTGYLSRPVIG